MALIGGFRGLTAKEEKPEEAEHQARPIPDENEGLKGF